MIGALPTGHSIDIPTTSDVQVRMRVVLLALLATLCLAQEYGAEYRGRRRARGGNNGLLPAVFGGMVGTVAGAWIQGGRIKKKYEKEKKVVNSLINSIRVVA